MEREEEKMLLCDRLAVSYIGKWIGYEEQKGEGRRKKRGQSELKDKD